MRLLLLYRPASVLRGATLHFKDHSQQADILFGSSSCIQSAQTILTQFDTGLAKQAIENLQNTGVTVRTGVRVVEVTRDQVCLLAYTLKGGVHLDQS